VVGRELLTMCPNGEDHPGHDWGEANTRPGLLSSRGPNMTIVSKNWRLMTTVCVALNYSEVMHRRDLFRMNYVLLV
jgi:hypothetical protein